jgi:hypothetical protein
MKSYPQEADAAAIMVKCNRAFPPNRPATISSNREVRFPLATCFVIQPFDEGGKFDKRYADVFEPAIRDAGLEPYRVDNDPSSTIPIDEIQDGIRRASVCLADITLDNPNVWFELGYALASDKETCLICSEERTGKYPFDVQHRAIIKYRVGSPSDFAILHDKMTERFESIMDKSATLAKIEAQSPVKDIGGLLQHEMIVLASIAENLQGPGDTVSYSTLREELERLGYNNLALNIGLGGLIERRMVTPSKEEGNDYNTGPYTYTAYSLDSDGMRWITRNYERLNLKVTSRSERKPMLIDLDEDIPF